MSSIPPEPSVPGPSAASDWDETRAIPKPGAGERVSPAVAPRRIWAFALGGALVAGLLSWLGGEAVRGTFPTALAPTIVPFPTGADRAQVIQARTQSATISFLQQAAILGAALGLAGGFAGRSLRAGIAGTAAGLVLGAASAAGAAHGILPYYHSHVDPHGHNLMYPLLTHGVIWAASGVAAGLAFGLGLGVRGRLVHSALGGLLDAIAATMLYDLVGGLAFPLDKTNEPISATALTRALAQFAVAVFVAAGAALGASDAPPAVTSTR